MEHLDHKITAHRLSSFDPMPPMTFPEYHNHMAEAKRLEVRSAGRKEQSGRGVALGSSSRFQNDTRLNGAIRERVARSN